MHAQIDDGDDRLAVGRPGGVVDRVLEVGQQRLRRSARGRHDERSSCCSTARTARWCRRGTGPGCCRARAPPPFPDLVSREGAGVGAGDVHHPHFAAEAVADERRRAALHRDLRAVAREPVFEHRRLAGRQLRSAPVATITFQSGAACSSPRTRRRRRAADRARVRRWLADRWRGNRRPCRRATTIGDDGWCGVTGEGARLSAIGRDQLDLTVAQEQERLAVGRPANAARGRDVAAFGEGELHRRAVRCPAATGARSAGPLSSRLWSACRRASGRPGERRGASETLQLGEVDERHRPRGFARRAGRPGTATARRARQPRPTASDVRAVISRSGL